MFAALDYRCEKWDKVPKPGNGKVLSEPELLWK